MTANFIFPFLVQIFFLDFPPPIGRARHTYKKEEERGKRMTTTETGLVKQITASDRRIVFEAVVVGGDSRSAFHKRTSALAAALSANVAPLLDVVRGMHTAGAELTDAEIERFCETVDRCPAAITKAIEEFIQTERELIATAKRKSDRRKHRERVGV
jgi:hypothetical protein